ncbi:MAG TPA: HdeD family acid-resistance protein [Trebonia sp.]|nr:HdeD family acid-resistance protein [Trebonia sp.]
MDSDRPGVAPEGDASTQFLNLGWQTSMIVGAISLVLGLIVAFHPSGSLNVIAVLLGVLLIISGIFQLVRALGTEAGSKIWPAIAGVLFILGGIVLIRHLHLSLALIGLFIGFTWVIQGIAALLAGFSGHRYAGRVRWWPVVFGAISLIAGIIVVSTPVSSVTVLATFIGIWFAVMGVFQIIDGWIARGAVRAATRGPVTVPGPRPGRAPGQDTTGEAARQAGAARNGQP